MSYYINIEDLAANSLIEAKKQKKDFVSYKEIEKYGVAIEQFLMNEYNRKSVISSVENTGILFNIYSDFFEESEENNICGIKIQKGKLISDLIIKFRGYLPLEILMAFVDKKTIEIFMKE